MTIENKRFKKTKICGLLLAVAVLAAGCGGKNTPASSEETTQVVKEAVVDDRPQRKIIMNPWGCIKEHS